MPYASRGSGPPSDEFVYAIVQAVADHRDISVTSLQPLAGVVDADALAAVLTRSPTPVTVEFDFSGVHVEVESNGTITVTDGSHGAITHHVSQ